MNLPAAACRPAPWSWTAAVVCPAQAADPRRWACMRALRPCGALACSLRARRHIPASPPSLHPNPITKKKTLTHDQRDRQTESHLGVRVRLSARRDAQEVQNLAQFSAAAVRVLQQLVLHVQVVRRLEVALDAFTETNQGQNRTTDNIKS